MKITLLALLLAVLTLVFATGVGLGIIHLTAFPYTVDINYLDIPGTSGLEREEILENYNAVMKFLSPGYHFGFDLPTLKYSETGAEHFYDCKQVFDSVYGAAMIAMFGIGLLVGLIRKVGGKALKYSGILTIAIPLVFALIIAIDFDAAFVAFHDIFFPEGTWIFDPAVDEIIKILPAEFFMHCALFIAAFWVITGISQILIGIKWDKTNKLSK